MTTVREVDVPRFHSACYRRSAGKQTIVSGSSWRDPAKKSLSPPPQDALPSAGAALEKLLPEFIQGDTRATFPSR